MTDATNVTQAYRWMCALPREQFDLLLALIREAEATAEAASKAEIAELVEALEGLIEWVKSEAAPGDAPERLRLAYAAISLAKHQTEERG